MPTAEIKRYWDAVAALGCVVCQSTWQTTIHHVHGGSCPGLRGMGQKSSDWLVIGLCQRHHTGKDGIDGSLGVRSWEERYRPQLWHLLRVGRALGIDTFARAEVSLDKLWSLLCSETSPRSLASLD